LASFCKKHDKHFGVFLVHGVERGIDKVSAKTDGAFLPPKIYNYLNIHCVNAYISSQVN